MIKECFLREKQTFKWFAPFNVEIQPGMPPALHYGFCAFTACSKVHIIHLSDVEKWRPTSLPHSYPISILPVESTLYELSSPKPLAEMIQCQLHQTNKASYEFGGRVPFKCTRTIQAGILWAKAEAAGQADKRKHGETHEGTRCPIMHLV